MNKTIRTIAVVASAALVMGALVGPAEAKKKRKPKPPAACPAFVPTNAHGADMPTTIVTDSATADAPVEVKVETAEGIGSASSGEDSVENGAPSHTYVNIQVDSAAPTTGLYVTLEFSQQWDYDLMLRTAEPNAVAYSAGGAPYAGPFDGTGHGGHAAAGSENIDGITTNDCGGYTVDVVGSTTPGEEVTLKYWLGEATYTPGA